MKMKLKTTLLFFGLLLCIQTLFGQSLFYFNAGDTTLVFGERVNVRNQPGTEAPVAFQLAAGDMVILLEERAERSTLKNLDLPWYKIKTASGQTGFIWGGVLSLWGAQQDGDVKFVAGALQSDGKKAEQDGVPTYTFEVRAVRNGVVVGKVSTTIQNEGMVRPRAIETGARGLQGYRSLLCFDIGVDACGYPNHEWFVLWDGQKLVQLPVITSIADADVFYHVEDYVFPEGSPFDDSMGHFGDPNLIYLRIAHGEKEELDDNKGWNENSWERARPMRWDGKQFVKPKDMGEPKN